MANAVEMANRKTAIQACDELRLRYRPYPLKKGIRRIKAVSSQAPQGTGEHNTKLKRPVVGLCLEKQVLKISRRDLFSALRSIPKLGYARSIRPHLTCPTRNETSK